MKSDLLKVLHPVAGRPMVEHVLRAARGAGVERCLVVVGFQADRVREALGEGVQYVTQSEQLGTGHAVLQTEPHLKGLTGHLLVLYGDNPLLTPETIRGLVRRHVESGADATALTAIMPDPTSLGRILRDEQGRYVRTVEEKDATPEQKAIREAMSGIFCFRMPLIFDLLKQLRADNSQKEYYLIDVLGLLVGRGARVEIEVAEDYRTVIGPNTRKQLAQAEAIMRERVLDRLMESGVTIVDPSTTYIHDGVGIERDTTVLPFTFIEGETSIGSGCVIGPFSRVMDSRIEDQVEIGQSVVERSIVRSRARIGPFSHLRPGSDIGEGAEIGNYAETKNAKIGAGTKSHHHSYLGDVTIGPGSNIGAGVVVVNYDGVRKHHTDVGERAFIGCNVNLVAPVRVGDGAYVAAGSTVNRDVPPDALAIARERQVNKEGYVRKIKGKPSIGAGKEALKENN